MDRNKKANQIEKQIQDINQRVLQQKVKGFRKIIKKSTFTQLYELDLVSQVWHVMDIAGPLFLIQVTESPFYQIVIMNQKSDKDYIKQLSDKMKFESVPKKNFIHFKTEQNTINGLWISQSQDIQELYQLIIENINKNSEKQQ